MKTRTWIIPMTLITLMPLSGISQQLDVQGHSKFRGRLDAAASPDTTSVYVGRDAGIMTVLTNRQNSFFGVHAGQKNTTGFFNSFFGWSAGLNNTMGSDNSFFGFSAGSGNTTGGFNSFFGRSAGSSNMTGGSNSFFGFSAGSDNTTGGSNAFFGLSAGTSNTTGSGNTCIGHSANVSSNALTNATALGSGASVNASNKVRIGNASVTVIEGQVGFSSSSDGRLKEAISPVRLGLSFINDLRPVEYHRIAHEFPDREMGLIAQELQEILRQHGAEDMGLINRGNSEEDYLSVRYNDLLAPMIRAIQELTAENAQLRKEHGEAMARLQQYDDNISNLQLQLTALTAQVSGSDGTSVSAAGRE